MHSFAVSLLLSITLACPYECAVKAAVAQSSRATANVCCENCRTHDEAPVRDDQPSGDDDGWCMCEGAVFDVSGQQVMDDVVISSWELAIGGESLRPELLRQNRLLDAGEPPPSHDGGLLVRILNQSFLL